jgi:hypothetical protein
VALASQAKKAAIPVAIEADRVERYPHDVEASRLLLLPRGAATTSASMRTPRAPPVRLAVSRGRLTFEVRDDGGSFDPTTVGYGTRLMGMADRSTRWVGLSMCDRSPDEARR